MEASEVKQENQKSVLQKLEEENSSVKVVSVDTTRYTFTPSAANNVLPVNEGTHICIFSSNYDTIYLPTRAQLAAALGVSSSYYFCVRITVWAARWGIDYYYLNPPSEMTIYGRNGSAINRLALAKNMCTDIQIDAQDTYYAYIMSQNA